MKTFIMDFPAASVLNERMTNAHRLMIQFVIRHS